jgi:hypothetical protein
VRPYRTIPAPLARCEYRQASAGFDGVSNLILLRDAQKGNLRSYFLKSFVLLFFLNGQRNCWQGSARKKIPLCACGLVDGLLTRYVEAL